MSQYGYIPQEKAHLLQEIYSIATPDTWTFEKNGIQYGGVEENVFSYGQKQELESLGGQWFESASSFSGWLNS